MALALDKRCNSGYDSDVAREKNMDYSSKTYAPNIRDVSGVKPNAKVVEEEEK